MAGELVDSIVAGTVCTWVGRTLVCVVFAAGIIEKNYKLVKAETRLFFYYKQSPNFLHHGIYMNIVEINYVIRLLWIGLIKIALKRLLSSPSIVH